MVYVADFETTNDIDDCRIWLYGIMELGNPDNFIYGFTMPSFISYFEQAHKVNTAYIHNLAFDSEFIMCYLFSMGFVHVENKRNLCDHTFTTLISDKGQFYTMTICFYTNKHKSCKLILIDSYKIIPMSVDKTAKAFGMSVNKLKIDYTKKRPLDYVVTPDEIEYIRHDLMIPANALLKLFDEGLTKMTLGSNALSDYKRIIGNDQFEKMFPVLDYTTDQDLRKAYRGGFCFLKESEKEKDQEKGLVFDNNSIYPFVMYTKELPIGQPMAFKKKYRKNKQYPLYVQMLRCNFKVKKDFLPTIQLKNNCAFNPTDYITDTDGNDTVLTLTNVDLDLFFKHYDVYDLEYLGGYKFQKGTGMFKNYIDKWGGIKVSSKKSGNLSYYQIAKWMLNSLYGKFGLNPNVKSNIPYYDDETIHYHKSEPGIRDLIYLPMATFITSYARSITITAAQSLYNRFIYADTDSLHIKGHDLPLEIEIDPTELGKWKLELMFDQARYVRAKTYIEHGGEPGQDYQWQITAAGMPERCKYDEDDNLIVTYEDFKTGSKFPGKLTPKHVKGGIVLVETDFTIRV